MDDNTIPVERIMQTKVYQELLQKKEIIKMKFLNKREIRKEISHGLTVLRRTGEVPGNITGVNLRIIHELYQDELNQKTGS